MLRACAAPCRSNAPLWWRRAALGGTGKDQAESPLEFLLLVHWVERNRRATERGGHEHSVATQSDSDLEGKYCVQIKV